MNLKHIETIARELNIKASQVGATAKLIAEGGTVPFIARYRKEATGTLDEVAITGIRDGMLRLAQLDDEGKLGDHHAALAKAFCTAKSRETVSWGREVLGGNGIVADYNVARFFADAEALYSYEGTYQMQNLIVGKAITGHGAFV